MEQLYFFFNKLIQLLSNSSLSIELIYISKKFKNLFFRLFLKVP
jgi:hypothetical protein